MDNKEPERNIWTTLEVKELISLLKENTSLSDISIKLRRTKKDIVGACISLIKQQGFAYIPNPVDYEYLKSVKHEYLIPKDIIKENRAINTHTNPPIKMESGLYVELKNGLTLLHYDMMGLESKTTSKLDALLSDTEVLVNNGARSNILSDERNGLKNESNEIQSIILKTISHQNDTLDDIFNQLKINNNHLETMIKLFGMTMDMTQKRLEEVKKLGLD